MTDQKTLRNGHSDFRIKTIPKSNISEGVLGTEIRNQRSVTLVCTLFT